MKKYYTLEIELVLLQTQDVVTMSAFEGVTDGFDNPNQVGNF